MNPKLGLHLLILLSFSVLVMSCNSANSLAVVVEDEPVLSEAEIIIQAQLPAPLDHEVTLGVEVLDEVTGLAFNPTRYQLEKIDDLNYFVRITAPIGSILKYRYIKLTEIPSPEYSSGSSPIRYRLFHVTGPSIQKDFVAGWIDSPFSGETGTLLGKIITANGSAIPGIVVSIAGQTSTTNDDGLYQIDKIPAGLHTLTAVSQNGDFIPFQQGAVISANAITPADFQMVLTEKVRLTFIVDVPDGEYTNVPVRMVGNLSMLGNSWRDLNGGLSTLASTCPSMVRLDSGQYAITLEVGAGTYLEYKYSLGDGFWNAELSEEGSFVLRKVVVPQTDATYSDKVETWSSSVNAPVTFYVSVPQHTEPAKIISIRFNPFTWTNPIPMWSAGNNQWYYTLYNPLDILSQVSYQYCIDEKCVTDNGETVAISENAIPFFTPSQSSQSFRDEISAWR